MPHSYSIKNVWRIILGSTIEWTRGGGPPQITPPPNSDRQRGIILEFGFGHFWKSVLLFPCTLKKSLTHSPYTYIPITKYTHILRYECVDKSSYYGLKIELVFHSSYFASSIFFMFEKNLAHL